MTDTHRPHIVTGAEGVTEALAKVMGELPAIGKADRSPEGYSYRGIEAITKHLQPLLAKHGVVIVPAATLQNVVPSPAMKDGWQDVYLNVAWTIYGPDGSSIQAHTCGIGRDRADKGVNKAQTQAYKYLLLHLLSIADKADDADGQTYEADRHIPTAGEKLYARLTRVDRGSTLPVELKALAEQNGKRLLVRDFDDDPLWLELVTATPDAAT